MRREVQHCYRAKCSVRIFDIDENNARVGRTARDVFGETDFTQKTCNAGEIKIKKSILMALKKQSSI